MIKTVKLIAKEFNVSEDEIEEAVDTHYDHFILLADIIEAEENTDVHNVLNRAQVMFLAMVLEEKTEEVLSFLYNFSIEYHENADILERMDDE